MAVTVADSLLEVKDSIIETLKAENLKLQQKVEKLEYLIWNLILIKKISIIEGTTSRVREYYQMLMMIS